MDRFLNHLFDDLKHTRNHSLIDLQTSKERSAAKIRIYFKRLKLYLPKHLVDSTLENLYAKGAEIICPEMFIKVPEKLWTSKTEIACQPDTIPVSSQAFQSTICEGKIKPTPRFDDVSTICLLKTVEDEKPSNEVNMKKPSPQEEYAILDEIILKIEDSRQILDSSKEKKFAAIKKHFHNIKSILPIHIADMTLQELFDKGGMLFQKSEDGILLPNIYIPENVWKNEIEVIKNFNH